MDTPASHRTGTEPIFNLPATVLAWILIMLGVHAVRTWLLSEATDVELLIDWAFVPLRWTAAYGGLAPGDILATLALEPSQPERSLQLELAQYVLSEGAAKPWTGLTYAFLHGSWAHVALNSIWLAAFGTPVARRCGGLRFSFLAALTAVGGALAYVVVHPYQALPLVGASAAVSGMMAAAAWFMFAPISFRDDGRASEPHERPRERLSELARNRSVLSFLAVWLVANYISAVLAQPLGLTDASVAWEAHIGGFVVGLALFPLLDPIAPRRSGRLA